MFATKRIKFAYRLEIFKRCKLMTVTPENLFNMVMEEIALYVAQAENNPLGWDKKTVECMIGAILNVYRNFSTELDGAPYSVPYRGLIFKSQDVVDALKTNDFWPKWFNPFKGV